MINTWSYKEEYKLIRKKILKTIDKTLSSGNIFFGKEIQQFERNFSKYNNFKYGVAVGSGTDALHISLLALGIGHGDEVITVSNTAIATISAIVSTGATPRFIDVDNNYLIDFKKIPKKISKRTKAIIPVHLYGQSCQIDEICKIAKKFNLKVVEDCAQAQGAKFKNKYIGTFGDMACFSFYPTKILGAYGDGGFVGTNNKSLYEKIRQIRFYGIDQINKKNKFFKKYYSNTHGVNSRIDEIQCSILNLKLKNVNKYIKQRRKLAEVYREHLKNTGLILPKEKSGNRHVYHLFVVYHNKRDLILQKLKKKNINLSIQYPYPVHKMTAYKKFNNRKMSLPQTDKFSKGIFSLPMYPTLKEETVKKFIKILKKVIKSI